VTSSPKRINHQGKDPRNTNWSQTSTLAPKHVGEATSKNLAKMNKHQRKMQARRINKLHESTSGHGLAVYQVRSTVSKMALPKPAMSKKTNVVAAKKVMTEKKGFLTFSPFDSRFPVFFDSYSPWDARFPYGHVPLEFPSFSPFDARFPVNGNGLFRNIFLAKQAEKKAAALKKMMGNKGHGNKAIPNAPIARNQIASKSNTPKSAAAKPSSGAATQLPAGAVSNKMNYSGTVAPSTSAFPRFSPMARTDAATKNSQSTARPAAPSAQSPLSTMMTRANGGATASPTVRRPQQMR